jgi:hypothetical protein
VTFWQGTISHQVSGSPSGFRPWVFFPSSRVTLPITHRSIPIPNKSKRIARGRFKSEVALRSGKSMYGLTAASLRSRQSWRGMCRGWLYSTCRGRTNLTQHPQPRPLCLLSQSRNGISFPSRREACSVSCCYGRT